MKYYGYDVDSARLMSFVLPEQTKKCPHCGSLNRISFDTNDKLFVAGAIVTANSIDEACEKFIFMWDFIATIRYGHLSGKKFDPTKVSSL